MFNEVYNVVALIIFSIFYFITLITSYSFSPRNTLPTSKEQIDNLINSDEIQNNKISYNFKLKDLFSRLREFYYLDIKNRFFILH